ncbi:fibronectin type III domain-containing protein [Flavobacterium sp.]|uniref:fibronectin type III domain-containing protein n=1 Tax=Flavobacterium sp. TaxID=239 RepID=UPI00260AC2CF|nr:fibronectin type III domain-containing protein [Flavobacterium sp.]
MKIKLLHKSLWGFMAFSCLYATASETNMTPTYLNHKIVNEAPVAVEATNVMNTTFGAQWTAVAGATAYRLDVSATPFGQSPNETYLFENLPVGNVTYYTVTGLAPATPYYYRVRAVDDEGASANSNIVGVITTDFTIWNGSEWSDRVPTAGINAIINGLYDNGSQGSFTAKNLTVNNGGSVVVRTGTNMTVVNSVINNSTPNAFIVENNANLLQLAAVNTNSGEIIVKRNAAMRRLDYVYWSSPVVGQNLGLFSPATLTNRFFVIDEAANNFAAVNPALNDFTPAKGFMIRAPNNFPDMPQTFYGSFEGSPNNGTVTIPLTFNGQGYNLIGNPYPSTINASAFLRQNPEINTLYFWTHTAQGSERGANYATVNATGGTSSSMTNPVSETPNGTIQVGQGFVAKVSAPVTAVFANTIRIANNQNQFFRTETAEQNRLWLNLLDENNMYSQALIGYVSDATDGEDSQFDGTVIDASGTQLYTTIGNETPYAIQGKALPFHQTDMVAVGFMTDQVGSYTIALDHFDGIFAEGQDIFLKDNETNVVTNMKTDSYTFISAIGNFPSRFSIQYMNSTLGTTITEEVSNDVIVFAKDSAIEILSAVQPIVKLAVFDLSGRLLYSDNDVNSKTLALKILSPSQSLLLFQITDANGTTVTKKLLF